MALDLKLPIRDRAEVIDTDAISDLPAHVEAGEEREIVRELLVLLRQSAYPDRITIGMADDILADMSKPERRSLLDGLRRRLGLESIADYEAVEARRRAEMRIPSQRPPRLVFTESGAIVDLNEVEAEASRERIRERTLATQRAAEQAQRAVEAQGIREREQAAAEQLRRELPPGVSD